MKAKLINNSPHYQSSFNVYVDDEGNQTSTKNATSEQWESWGFKDVVIPTIDEATQKLGDWYETATEITRYVLNKTQEELDEYAASLNSNLINIQQSKKLKIANEKLIKQVEATLIDTSQTTDEEVLENSDFFDYWEVGVDYTANMIVNTFENQLYRCVQNHTSQESWHPSLVPAIFTPIAPPNTIPQWVQPTGAQDAYNTGDLVLFEDNTYESLIDANTWSPTAYPAGWLLIE